MTASAEYQPSDSAFTGEAVVDLIKTCLGQPHSPVDDDQKSEILAVEIFDLIVRLAVSPSCSELDYMALCPLQLPEVTTTIKSSPSKLLHLSSDGERQTQSRSQTCALWLTMLLREPEADKLLSLRIEQAQLALIR